MSSSFKKTAGKFINDTIEKWYGTPNYYNVDLLENLKTSKNPYPIFVMYLNLQLQRDLQARTSMFGLNKQLFPKDYYKIEIKNSMVDENNSNLIHQFQSLDHYWNKKEYQSLFKFFDQLENRKIAFTWSMNYSLNDEIYQKIFPDYNFPITYKEFLISELSKEKFFNKNQTFVEEMAEFHYNIHSKNYSNAEKQIINLIRKEPLMPINWLNYSILLKVMNREREANFTTKFCLLCNLDDPDIRNLLSDPSPLIKFYTQQTSPERQDHISKAFFDSMPISSGEITNKLNNGENLGDILLDAIIKNAPSKPPLGPKIADLMPIIPSSPHYIDPLLAPIIKSSDNISHSLSPHLMGRMLKKELPFSIEFARYLRQSQILARIKNIDLQIKHEILLKKTKLWDVISQGLVKIEFDPIFDELENNWKGGNYSKILKLLINPGNNFEQAKRVYSWLCNINLEFQLNNTSSIYYLILKRYRKKNAFDLVKSEMKKNPPYRKQGYKPTFNISHELLKKGKNMEAFKILSNSIDRDPFAYPEWISLAKFYMSVGSFKAAKEALRFALISDQYMNHAWYLLNDLPDNINK